MLRIFLFTFFYAIAIFSFGQQNEFRGIVKDNDSQKAIPFATIVAYNKTKLIDGVSTNNNGQFYLKVKGNPTHLEISFIGYKPLKLSVADIKESQNITIGLKQVSNELEEIVVQAERTTTQLKIDRKVINLGADLQQSGVTALEAFDQISEIQTDLGTGTLSLRGSGNVRLLVNGKPSALNSTELLDQIPASVIDKVEIITSPSAKNQADGLSGIINIILKKNLYKGLNLALNSSIGTKRHQFGLDGNYNSDNINFRLQASHGDRRMDSEQWIFQRYNNQSTRDFYAPHDFNGRVSRITSGLDFFFDDRNELSLEVNYTHDFHSFFNNTFY